MTQEQKEPPKNKGGRPRGVGKVDPAEITRRLLREVQKRLRKKSELNEVDLKDLLQLATKILPKDVLPAVPAEPVQIEIHHHVSTLPGEKVKDAEV